MERPHFLRVVQALALVSGFGSSRYRGRDIASRVRIVELHARRPPDPLDAAPDAFSVTTGTHPACTLDEAGTCMDASVGSGGIQVAPDAQAHVVVPVGGPLSPPELPA